MSCQACWLRLDHQRRDDGVLRVAAFYLREFAQVGLDGAVADELDVVEAEHFGAGVIEARSSGC